MTLYRYYLSTRLKLHAMIKNKLNFISSLDHANQGRTFKIQGPVQNQFRPYYKNTN